MGGIQNLLAPKVTEDDDERVGLNPSSSTWMTIVLIAGALVVGYLLRRPVITTAKSAAQSAKSLARSIMDKTHIRQLLSKYGHLPLMQAPAEAQPPSLAKVYSQFNPDTKQLIDTIPLSRLWGIEAYYNLNPDTAMANSVRKIADGPESFVRLMKQPAINLSRKYNVANPKILVAQAGHEGSWGKSAIGGTNIFGHVATDSWTKDPTKKYSFEKTWEERNGRKEPTVRPFRVYDTLEEALEGHIKVISNKWKSALAATTPEAYADMLVGGNTKYATDSLYKSKLVAAYRKVDSLWDKI